MKISSFQSTSSGGASGSGSGYGTSRSFNRSFNLRNLSKLMLPPLGYSQQSPAGPDKWVVSPLDSRYRWVTLAGRRHGYFFRCLSFTQSAWYDNAYLA
jgi:hypothetical protein